MEFLANARGNLIHLSTWLSPSHDLEGVIKASSQYTSTGDHSPVRQKPPDYDFLEMLSISSRFNDAFNSVFPVEVLL
ncbi:hypothetical protein RRF57_005556 [Xylaria bambusicola]|uniref:Uncharacterized protein n=1 Tax=Xylaria bambusicola TaxID=326684 RepID=A0AAN7Z9B6_9PEZI